MGAVLLYAHSPGRSSICGTVFEQKAQRLDLLVPLDQQSPQLFDVLDLGDGRASGLAGCAAWFCGGALGGGALLLAATEVLLLVVLDAHPAVGSWFRVRDGCGWLFFFSLESNGISFIPDIFCLVIVDVKADAVDQVAFVSVQLLADVLDAEGHGFACGLFLFELLFQNTAGSECAMEFGEHGRTGCPK